MLDKEQYLILKKMMSQFKL